MFVLLSHQFLVEWIDQWLTKFSALGQYRVDDVDATRWCTGAIVSFSIQWNNRCASAAKSFMRRILVTLADMFIFSFFSHIGRLTAEVVKGSHFRNLSLNKAPDTYVKLCLVSSMGQEMAKAKTSTRRGQPNPLFKESFVFQVSLCVNHAMLSLITLSQEHFFYIFPHSTGCAISIERCHIDGVHLCQT